MLMNMQCCKPQGDFILQLGSKPFLNHIIAALDIQVLKSNGVSPKQFIGILWHKSNSEEAAQVMCARPGSNLKEKTLDDDTTKRMLSHQKYNSR